MIYYSPQTGTPTLSDPYVNIGPDGAPNWRPMQNVYYKPTDAGGWHPLYNYRWDVGGWGGCSAVCGGGVQYRSVVCTQFDAGVSRTVPDAYCLTEVGAKPPVSQVCNTHPCMSGITVSFNTAYTPVCMWLFSEPTGSPTNTLLSVVSSRGTEVGNNSFYLTDVIPPAFQHLQYIYFVALKSSQMPGPGFGYNITLSGCTATPCTFFSGSLSCAGSGTYLYEREEGGCLMSGDFTHSGYVISNLSPVPDNMYYCYALPSDPYVDKCHAPFACTQAASALCGAFKVY